VTTRKQEIVHALKTAIKNNVVSFRKGGDYAIVGYNEEIKFEVGAKIRDFIEKDWNEVI
jgi:hypothetical protein